MTPADELKAIDEEHERLEQEQSLYARVLERWTLASAGLLLLSFAVYALGLVDPHVALERLPRLWSQPLEKYLALSGTHPGWAAVDRMGRSDALNVFCVGLLSSAPAISLLVLLPGLLRRRDWAHALFCIGLVAVLALAAAGVPARRG